jgi:phospholipid/cholesterol/gamma-HCH transport system substrate-binding protein
VQTATADISKVSSELSANMSGLIADASDTLGTLQHTFETADQTITSAEPDIKATLEDLRHAAAAIRTTADTAQAMLEENRAPINDFAQEGLYEFSEFIVDARALVASLTQIAVQLERDPASFLLGGNQSGYQAQ